MSLPTGYVQDPLFDVPAYDATPKQRALGVVHVWDDVEMRPLKVHVTVAFIRRLKRARCSSCTMYRVVFVLQASSGEESLPICGKCAGIR
jgi:hypothetical protein